jgi:hypothetical protein
VIISQKVEEAVENEDANFLFEGAAKAKGVAVGDGRRDGDVAEERAIRGPRLPAQADGTLALLEGKGQHVGRFWLSAIFAVQSRHFPVGYEAHKGGIVTEADFFCASPQEIIQPL